MVLSVYFTFIDWTVKSELAEREWAKGRVGTKPSAAAGGLEPPRDIFSL